MANMESIHESLGPNVCRRCIRKRYNVDLQPEDCVYAHFPGECSCCGIPHNLVVGLRLSGKLKLLGKRVHNNRPNDRRKANKRAQQPLNRGRGEP